MNTRKRPGLTDPRHGQQGLSEVSQIAGGAPPLLPGESEQEYLAGRQGAIEELGAVTPLQVYLAEKIFDCLWWMRAYETQKRANAIRAMSDHLLPPSSTGDLRLSVMRALTERDWQDADLQRLMLQKGLTPDALLQVGMSLRAEALANLEDLIALRAKTLAAMQSSYEGLLNRGFLQERLRLQNELLKKDLTAIDVEAVTVVASDGASNDKPKRARR